MFNENEDKSALYRNGKVKKGYKANLVVLNANPITDIRNTTKIQSVINRGNKLKITRP